MKVEQHYVFKQFIGHMLFALQGGHDINPLIDNYPSVKNYELAFCDMRKILTCLRSCFFEEHTSRVYSELLNVFGGGLYLFNRTYTWLLHMSEKLIKWQSADSFQSIPATSNPYDVAIDILLQIVDVDLSGE